MRRICFVIIVVLTFFIGEIKAQNPLSVFSEEWNDSFFIDANTAKDVAYMTEREKDVIWILNLARMDPQLFNETVVKDYDKPYPYRSIKKSPYKQSLIRYLDTLDIELPLLYPKKELFTTAYCHAVTAGKKGYTGHKRQSPSCKLYNAAECCDYGNETALDIVMSFLVDEGVPNLGHRIICFGNYSLIGVAIQPHKTYRINTVINFQ